MATYIDIEQSRILSVPTDADIYYPEEDGKPMAASDLHREILTRTIDALTEHYHSDSSVYVSGDILMYYVEGVPAKSVSPDVLVTFGIGKKRRYTYKVWEVGKAPDFAMEFSSENTYRNDLSFKKELYASLGIRDYFLYDAEAKYLRVPLMGFTLVDAVYEPIPADARGGVRSAALNLDFHVREDGLGIYNPVTGKWVKTRAGQEAAARRRAEAGQQEEAAARQEEAAARRRAEAGQQEEAAARQEEAAARRRAEAAQQEEAAGRQEEAAARRRAEAAQQEEAAGRQEEAAGRQEEAAARKKTEAALEKADAKILQLQEEIERLQTRR